MGLIKKPVGKLPVGTEWWLDSHHSDALNRNMSGKFVTDAMQYKDMPSVSCKDAHDLNGPSYHHAHSKEVWVYEEDMLLMTEGDMEAPDFVQAFGYSYEVKEAHARDLKETLNWFDSWGYEILQIERESGYYTIIGRKAS